MSVNFSAASVNFSRLNVNFVRPSVTFRDASVNFAPTPASFSSDHTHRGLMKLKEAFAQANASFGWNGLG